MKADFLSPRAGMGGAFFVDGFQRPEPELVETIRAGLDAHAQRTGTERAVDREVSETTQRRRDEMKAIPKANEIKVVGDDGDILISMLDGTGDEVFVWFPAQFADAVIDAIDQVRLEIEQK